jgi:uncharacterized repeat protein (TIGR01451 family)
MNRYIFSLFFSIVNFSYAVGVPSGTKIVNVAHLDYKVDSVSFSATSNRLVDIVDQKIDMKMVCQESRPVVVGVGEKKRAMSFMLSNTGNGTDRYSFSPIEGETLDFKVDNAEVYQDNGDGVFSKEDSLATEVEVEADANVTLFLVSDIPDDAKKLSFNGIKVSSAIQGSLVYGESKKLDDFYAVMVAPEDAKSDVCAYEVSNLALKLEKTATLSSDKPYSGSIIHYKIAVKVIGEGVVESVVVKDNIPTGTTYIADSLKLDGVTAGDFNGTAISVALASIAQTKASSEPKHHVTFDVRIQ